MKASASYKKQDGAIEYDERRKTVVWTPSKRGDTVSLAVSAITNLQQTPAGSEKVGIKIVAEAGSHTFIFTSGERARVDQEAITASLRDAIADTRTNTSANTGSSAATPATNGDGPSPAMAIAQAVRSEADTSNTWSDDKRLMSNATLQESLFQKEPELRRRFQQALQDKPETITHSQFGTQFWSSRLHLLRSHDIERRQHEGSYNVLAQLKAISVDGERKMNVTGEQIQALFRQHPFLKLIYNELVPRTLSERDFWTRFFSSKLFKKLKGEKLHKDLASDDVFDKYLNQDESDLHNKQIAESHVPHFIDLEGNEQNQKWKGNKPDKESRPEFTEKAPLLGNLNQTSWRMLANVTVSEGQHHAPIGTREDTFEELRLQDLESESSDDRVRLNISNQQRLFGGNMDEANGNTSKGKRTERDFIHTLDVLRQDLSRDAALDMESVENDEDTSSKSRAVSQVVSLITHQRNLTSTVQHDSNLTEDTLQSLQLTMNTTTEFLNYFWTVLQAVAAGSSSSTKQNLAALNATLIKSRERITAVGETAESERGAQIKELKRSAREYYEKTGKKRRIDESQVTVGGKKDVESLLQPTIKALEFAQARYEAVIAE